MNEVDWNEAPDGAMRHNGKIGYSWLRKVNERIDYYINDAWVSYSVEQAGKEHWRDATKRPMDTPTDIEQRTSASTAVHTLESLGYTWCGGELWKPPVGKAPQYVADDIDTTITQRGERYGKFKDGSVIMQDLKNIMRETPNWEGLTPSQREALEMIQHKIGRILNGDPMYVDSWTDISGYSKLIADELNGAVR